MSLCTCADCVQYTLHGMAIQFAHDVTKFYNIVFQTCSTHIGNQQFEFSVKKEIYLELFRINYEFIKNQEFSRLGGLIENSNLCRKTG
jgi:hypothetical protein